MRVDAGDNIVSVAGIAISGMTKAEFVDTVKSQARPISIVMSRQVEPAELQELQELDKAMEKHRAELDKTKDRAVRKAKQKQRDDAAERFEASFAAGPLGLGFAVRADGAFCIENVQGQAEALGVRTSDTIECVEGVLVQGMSKDQFIQLIQSFARPVSITFSRNRDVNGGLTEDTANDINENNTRVSDERERTAAIVLQCWARQRKANERVARRIRKRDKKWKKEAKEARRQARAARQAAAEAAANVTPEREMQMSSHKSVKLFAAGSLGLGFAVMSDGTFRIEKVSGQAEELGVEAGDEIVAVEDTAVQGLSKAEFIGVIQAHGRPLRVVFSRWGARPVPSDTHEHQTQMQEMVAEAQSVQSATEFQASFAAGPLGLGFAVMSDGTFRIEKVSGQAEELGVEAGDEIVAVEDTTVQGLSKAEFIGVIQAHGRPLRVMFSRWGAATTGLPPGWSEEVDASTGERYYFNEHTGESTWDMPTS